MSYRKQQNGFALIEGLLIVIVLTTISVIGYTVFKRTHKNPAGGTTSKNSTESAKETPAISTKQDLSKAVEDLKKTDMDTKKDEASLEQLAQ